MIITATREGKAVAVRASEIEAIVPSFDRTNTGLKSIIIHTGGTHTTVDEPPEPLIAQWREALAKEAGDWSAPPPSVPGYAAALKDLRNLADHPNLTTDEIRDTADAVRMERFSKAHELGLRAMLYYAVLCAISHGVEDPAGVALAAMREHCWAERSRRSE